MSSQPYSQPYIKFYPRDWIGDAALRMISPEERGVWIDLLCLMAGGTPYGHLALNGQPLTDEAVSRAVGIDIDRFRAIVAALEGHGIPSRTPEGVLYSRRLVREHGKFVSCREAGKKGGGNPALHKESGSDSHIPESRIHIPEAKGGLKVNPKVPLKVTYKGTFKGHGDKSPFSVDFESFWTAYPRKIGKQAALKAWQRATGKPPIQAIIEAIRQQAQSEQWRKDGGQYIPHPATWLNQGRWDDKPEIERPQRVCTLDAYAAEAKAKKEAERLASLKRGGILIGYDDEGFEDQEIPE